MKRRKTHAERLAEAVQADVTASAIKEAQKKPINVPPLVALKLMEHIAPVNVQAEETKTIANGFLSSPSIAGRPMKLMAPDLRKMRFDDLRERLETQISKGLSELTDLQWARIKASETHLLTGDETRKRIERDAERLQAAGVPRDAWVISIHDGYYTANGIDVRLPPGSRHDPSTIKKALKTLGL